MDTDSLSFRDPTEQKAAVKQLHHNSDYKQPGGELTIEWVTAASSRTFRHITVIYHNCYTHN